MSLPTYPSVIDALAIYGSSSTPAETHGLLTAFVACEVNIQKQAWINTLKSLYVSHEDAQAQAATEALEKLYDQTHQQLKGDDFEFNLLLPEDDRGFEERVEALAQWCQGFVSGLNLMGVDLNRHFNEEVDEALQDLVKLSCLSLDQEENSGTQENESAYVELSEYARVAVMLIRAHHTTMMTKLSSTTKH